MSSRILFTIVSTFCRGDRSEAYSAEDRRGAEELDFWVDISCERHYSAETGGEVDVMRWREAMDTLVRYEARKYEGYEREKAQVAAMKRNR